jgi:translation elongation factor EF-1beta
MDSIKFYAKTAAAAMIRWLLLSGIGVILAIIGIYIAMHLIGNNTGSGIGASFGMLTTFKEEFWSALLLIASFAFVFIYPIVASKVALSFIIGGLYENKLAGVIGEKVTNTLRVMTQSASWEKSVTNATALKEKLSSATKEDSTINKVQQKAISYALKKVNLDDVNFKQDNPNLPEDISNKVMNQLSELAQPSYALFWIAVGAHAVFVTLAFVFDHY